MVNSCIQYLDEIVKLFPNKTAFVDDKRTVTFQELQNRAISISKNISTVYYNKPIAIFLPKSISCVESFFAVLYSGNFYVPLDVKSPIERTNKIIENLGTSIIITNNDYLSKVNTISSNLKIKVLNIDNVDYKNYLCISRKSILDRIIDINPIYCIYTSGSSGTPKGVVLSHRAISDFIEWIVECYDLNQNTILGNQSPFLFDVSVIDIYVSIRTGATTYIIPEYLFSFPKRLLEYIENNNINFIIWVPSVLINIANSNVLPTFNYTGLRKILFAGEVMPNKHLNQWRNHIPDALYSNLYGPTEASVIATYYIVDRIFNDNDPLPIGFPCKNIETLILSDDNKPVINEEIGELCLKGTALALGYWNDFEKTKRVFIQNPINNNYPEIIYRTGDLVKLNEKNEIIYIGRKDSQIKHVGYRIEIGEIESSILLISEIDNSCVIYNDIKSYIALFYVSKNNEVNDIFIRNKLSNILPKYMIPTKFYSLTTLPLNSNGKIDRSFLKNEYFT